jgi:hypothetical protein
MQRQAAKDAFMDETKVDERVLDGNPKEGKLAAIPVGDLCNRIACIRAQGRGTRKAATEIN